MHDKFKKICATVIEKSIGEPPLTYKVALAANGAAMRVMKVHSMTRSCNAEVDTAVTTHLTVAVPTSEFMYLMSNGRGDLKVQISTYANGKHLETETLYGVSTTPIDPNFNLQSKNTGSADDTGITIVTLELYPEPIWLNRLRPIGTTFQEETPLTAVKFILASLTQGYLPSTNAHSIVYEEEEQKHYHSIQIPDNTPFLGVFDYIQNHYGVYSKGIAVCYHKQTWRCFKPYDVEKYKTPAKRLCIYALNPEHGNQLERSLHVDGNTYSIVTVGDPVLNDDRDIEALNGGTGYRVASVRSLDMRTGTLDPDTDNVTTPDEYISTSNPNPHKTGLGNVQTITERFKDDDKSILSEFNRKRGVYAKVQWQRSIYGILYPGMGVKYIYSTPSGLVERYGVLLGEVYHTSIDGGMLGSDTYVSESELLLWLV